MLHVPANGLLFFVILALAYRAVYMKDPQNLLPLPEIKIVLHKYLRILFIVILSILLVFVESLILRRYQAEAAFKRVNKKKISETNIDAIIEYKKILKEIDEAITLNSLNSQYLNKKADLLSEIALREDLKDELENITEFKDPNEVLRLAGKFYKQAIDLNPTKADYHLRLGWLYSVLGQSDLTEKEFKNALSLDPQNTQIQSYVEEYLKKIQELK